ncbi:RNA-guided endonuclease IscB [Salicibibacter cibarius]|uniref:RNA-guided endonuclease IscB n=1 Tax=Salicibibacter cibarius TaxID=2743000 RepID=UPI001FECABDA|nr:RNA-guided endonuclease IscB [Salicibibacter cibarius]
MLVFVKNRHGESLMPCKPQKARRLLKQKKAKIVSYEPFTIQLLYGSSGYKQNVNIGVDLGAKDTGVAITSEDKVLAKGDIETRQDVKNLLNTRRAYRQSRRHRKTRYRKRPDGWLPPSIESRIQNTFRWIDKFCSLVPNPTLTIEVGKFDPHKMINPDILGIDYQKGQTPMATMMCGILCLPETTIRAKFARNKARY